MLDHWDDQRLLLEGDTVVAEVGDDTVRFGPAVGRWTSVAHCELELGDDYVELPRVEFEMAIAVLEELRSARGRRRASRVRCGECRSLTYPEHMDKEFGCCMGCASAHYGVLY